MKWLVLLAGLMVLAGCVSAGVKVDETSLATFEKGKTTYPEVLARLGQPTTSSLMPDGRRMLIYSWVQARARVENFIPLIGPFVGGADSRSSSVVVWIDGDGRLASYSISQSQYGMGRGLDAGADPGRVPGQPRAVSPGSN